MSIHPALQPRRVGLLGDDFQQLCCWRRCWPWSHPCPLRRRFSRSRRTPCCDQPALESELAAAGEPVSFLVVLGEQVGAQAALEAADFAAAEPLDRTARHGAISHADPPRASQPSAAARLARRPRHRLSPLLHRQHDRGARRRRDGAGAAQFCRSRPARRQPARRQPRSRRLPEGCEFPDKPRLPARPRGRPRHPHGDRALPYGLVYARARSQFWATFDLQGDGLVVANIDTGVQWDHPALKASYRGWNTAQNFAYHVYNWYDAWGASSCTSDPQIPCDDSGHGTHTVGTMTGDAAADNFEIIGMAPGAQWIGCRNMLDGWGTPASYAACFEFMLAPIRRTAIPSRTANPRGRRISSTTPGVAPDEGCDVDSLRRGRDGAQRRSGGRRLRRQ